MLGICSKRSTKWQLLVHASPPPHKRHPGCDFQYLGDFIKKLKLIVKLLEFCTLAKVGITQAYVLKLFPANVRYT